MSASATGWEYEGDLLRLFPVNVDGSSQRETPFTDSDFDRISEILECNNKRQWSMVVRTYALLRLSQAPFLLDDLIRDGTLDISIPYTEDRLPPRLSPSLRARFMNAQRFVMTSIMDLERGKHISISSVDDAFEVRNCLGQGGCGRVNKVYSKLSQRTYAVKFIQRKKTFDKDKLAISNFLKELNTSKRVDHRHVVKVVGSFTEKRYVGIVMGTIAEGDLEAFMRGEMDMDRKSLLRTFFGCLVSGLKAIHEERIRHKDIKPKNILIKSSRVLYTDFGIALDYSQTDRSTTRGRPAMFTPQYCAPEVANWKDRNSSSDMFSLATVFLEMVTRLNEKTIEDLHKFLDGDGNNNSTWYCKCLPQIRAWLDNLQTVPHGQAHNSIPVNWIRPCLEEEEQKRPTVYELWHWVEKDTAHAPYPFMCHECAADWFDSTDSAASEDEDNSGSDHRQGILSQEDQIPENHTVTPMVSHKIQDVYLPVDDVRPSGEHDQVSEEPDSSLLDLLPTLERQAGGGSEWDKKTSEKTSSELENVEKDVFGRVREFANKETMQMQERRRNEAWYDRKVRLSELSKFSKNFRLSTPVPKDLVPILAKDPQKQEAIISRSWQSEDMSASKVAAQGTDQKPHLRAVGPTGTVLAVVPADDVNMQAEPESYTLPKR